MAIVLEIVLGLMILASFFVAYMSARTWRIYQVILAEFVFLGIVAFFYLGARTLATLQELGRVYVRLKEPKSAQPILEKVVQGRRIVDGPMQAKTVRAVGELADVYIAQEQFPLAEARLVELMPGWLIAKFFT